MEVNKVDLKDVNLLPKLVSDYLSEDPKLKPFYNCSPSLKGLSNALNSRAEYPVERSVLVAELSKQHHASVFGTEQSAANIALLNDDNTFTITTGHQLCILGGPLFFIYKIASVVRLCERLRQEHPNKHFVPVYWMASEDHDADEIDHTYVKGHRVQWEHGQKGAVGRFSLQSFDAVLGEVEAILKDDMRYTASLKELRKAYRASTNLAQATHSLVNLIFGEQGVVTIDADRPALKQQFASVLKSELVGQFSHAEVERTNKSLGDLGFGKQVHSRELNLFYLTNGSRERMERTETGWKTVGGEVDWDQVALLKEVQAHPERFSPNVILRPVYQEVLLPNLAYIGGPGETSYWLQLKGVFDAAKVFYPVVLLRDMVYISDEKAEKRRAQLGLKLKDLFDGFEALEHRLIEAIEGPEGEVDEVATEVERLFDSLTKRMESYDPSLVASSDAHRQRIVNTLHRFRKKVLSSKRKQHSTVISRLDALMSHYFPGSTPQERRDNWLTYTHAPKAFVSNLIPTLAPLEGQIKFVDHSQMLDS